MALPHPSMNFVPLDTLTASELNQIVANILALSNGTGIGNGAIKLEHLNKASFGSAKTIYKFDDEIYNSNTYGDLAGGAGPSVTINVPSSGSVLVMISCGIYNSQANKFVGFAASGANTIEPKDEDAARNDSKEAIVSSINAVLTGLNPGETTFTLKYKGVNARFFSRKIIVIPLPS